MSKHYARLLNYWPRDLLRPNVSFRNVLSKRAALPAAAEDPAQVNALYSLLENRYSKTYPPSEDVLKPRSNPSHYADLLAEIEAAPKRTWLQSKINRWRGFLRFK